MSDNCKPSDCAECPSHGEGCTPPQKERLNEFSSVKRVIGVMSGKGGVGKSLVTVMLAVNMRKRGFKTAVLDADITGPSIPKMFGIHDLALSTEMGLMPLSSKNGIEVMSINMLLRDETEPILWRGPVIAGAVTQFWTDVIWEDTDFMFIDMPPGTGDVPLTVFQSLPIDGIVIVTSPQELVSMIVEKSVKMANTMNIPILAIVENMSYFRCPDCGKIHYPFGKSGIEDTARKYNIGLTASIPIDTKIASLCDSGLADDVDTEFLDNIADALTEKITEDKGD